MALYTTFQFSIQAGDGASGNVSLSKAISGLTYSGTLNQYIQAQTIGLAPPSGFEGDASTSHGTLAAGTYYYVVTAYNQAGESSSSLEISATLSGTASSIQLSWNPVPGALGYNIYRGTTSGGENVKYSTTLTGYTDTGAAGTSATPSGTNSSTTWTPVLPGLPIQTLYLRNISQNNQTLSVAWTKTGGSSQNVLDLLPNASISFCEPVAAPGIGGISALTVTASSPGAIIEAIWSI